MSKNRTDAIALISLFAFVCFSVYGYIYYGLNPERLWGKPLFSAWFAQAFTVFAQVQVYMALAVILFYSWRHFGTKWIVPFISTYILSLTSELMGTGFGIPFGPYSYSEFLGVKVLGLVPIVIPMSWFTMAWASYHIVNWLAPLWGRWTRIAVASALLTLWDVALDPAMSYVTNYWIWHEAGPFYGMPSINFFGWFVTGLALISVYEFYGSHRLTTPQHGKWMALYYLVNLALPIGMVLGHGYWDILVYVVLGLVLFGLATRTGARKKRTPQTTHTA